MEKRKASPGKLKPVPLTGFKIPYKKKEYPAVPSYRKVVVVALLRKGLPSAAISVSKYSKGWGKSYKSFAEAVKDRHIDYWKP